MTGINNGQPEATIGEPIRFGNDLDYEIEQHPISDRLLIRDTANGKVAYIRAEDSGQIGGDGVLIKALKESKPMNDTGRTYDTIQEAEREASAWVFVPTGTYNESVEINTEGLTLQGCGYNTFIDATGLGNAIFINSESVSVESLSVSNGSGDGIGVNVVGDNVYLSNITVKSSGDNGIDIENGTKSIVVNCIVRDVFHYGIQLKGGVVNNCIVSNSRSHNIINREKPNSIISNNMITGATTNGIFSLDSDDSIIVGNRITNSGDHGIRISSSNNIVANNRVSDSTNVDINDNGTGTLLDGNLTGASN